MVGLLVLRCRFMRTFFQPGISYFEPTAFKARGAVTQGVDIDTQNTYSYNIILNHINY